MTTAIPLYLRAAVAPGWKSGYFTRQPTQNGTHGEDSRLYEKFPSDPAGHPRAKERWTQIELVITRFRTNLVYLDALLPGGQVVSLCRLRYGDNANSFGIATYHASHDDYQVNYLPTGSHISTAEEALDTSVGIYLADPNIWTYPPAF